MKKFLPAAVAIFSVTAPLYAAQVQVPTGTPMVLAPVQGTTQARPRVRAKNNVVPAVAAAVAAAVLVAVVVVATDDASPN